MSALALIARRRGVPVTGCDRDLAGAADVAAAGATLFEGHDPAHVEGTRGVVVTAAVAADHPELVRARAMGLPVVPRKRALGALVNGGTVAAIAGTHGKTTTTAMATEALAAAGLAPTGIAGGRVASWGGNARIGNGQLFVVEADEYDRAFLELEPTVAVVTNVEADHLEYYGTVAALEDAFVRFASRAKRVIVGHDDPGARRVAARLAVPVWRFGGGDADIQFGTVVQTPTGTSAMVNFPGGRSVALRLRVPGLHNLRNAAAALGVVAALEGSLERAAEGLGAFTGVGRRFERLGEVNGVAVVDDYAHHPTELVATLAAARQTFPKRRLVAVFQPHLYSRTQAHAEAMGVALAMADLVVVADVYAAREAPIAGVSGKLVADAAQRAGAAVIYEADRSQLARRVFDELESGDVVLTLGAGDITRVAGELVQWLGAA